MKSRLLRLGKEYLGWLLVTFTATNLIARAIISTTDGWMGAAYEIGAWMWLTLWLWIGVRLLRSGIVER